VDRWIQADAAVEMATVIETPEAQGPAGEGWGVAALVLGIVGVVTCWMCGFGLLPGIGAVVCYFVQRRRRRRSLCTPDRVFSPTGETFCTGTRAWAGWRNMCGREPDPRLSLQASHGLLTEQPGEEVTPEMDARLRDFYEID